MLCPSATVEPPPRPPTAHIWPTHATPIRHGSATSRLSSRLYSSALSSSGVRTRLRVMSIWCSRKSALVGLISTVMPIGFCEQDGSNEPRWSRVTLVRCSRLLKNAMRTNAMVGRLGYIMPPWFCVLLATAPASSPPWLVLLPRTSFSDDLDLPWRSAGVMQADIWIIAGRSLLTRIWGRTTAADDATRAPGVRGPRWSRHGPVLIASRTPGTALPAAVGSHGAAVVAVGCDGM